MTTWEDARAGSIVLGYDGNTYGVTEHVPHPAGPIVTLVRYGVRTGPAQPPPLTPITIVEPADMTAEANAFAVLSAAGLAPELLRETYE